MVKPLLLEGIVEQPETSEPQEWRREKERLEDEVRSLKRDLEDAEHDKEKLARVVKSLQSALGPVYRSLRALFGEIELAVGEEQFSPNGAATAAPSAPQQTDPRWQSFKNQFPGVPSEIVDALLVHGDMKITNLSKFLKRHYETTRVAVTKLRDAGALTYSSGLVSLRR